MTQPIEPISAVGGARHVSPSPIRVSIPPMAPVKAPVAFPNPSAPSANTAFQNISQLLGGAVETPEQVPLAASDYMRKIMLGLIAETDSPGPVISGADLSLSEDGTTEVAPSIEQSSLANARLGSLSTGTQTTSAALTPAPQQPSSSALAAGNSNSLAQNPAMNPVGVPQSPTLQRLAVEGAAFHGASEGSTVPTLSGSSTKGSKVPSLPPEVAAAGSSSQALKNLSQFFSGVESPQDVPVATADYIRKTLLGLLAATGLSGEAAVEEVMLAFNEKRPIEGFKAPQFLRIDLPGGGVLENVILQRLGAERVAFRFMRGDGVEAAMQQGADGPRLDPHTISYAASEQMQRATSGKGFFEIELRLADLPSDVRKVLESFRRRLARRNLPEAYRKYSPEPGLPQLFDPQEVAARAVWIEGEVLEVTAGRIYFHLTRIQSVEGVWGDVADGRGREVLLLGHHNPDALELGEHLQLRAWLKTPADPEGLNREVWWSLPS